jgi:hypothetical protein
VRAVNRQRGAEGPVKCLNLLKWRVNIMSIKTERPNAVILARQVRVFLSPLPGRLLATPLIAALCAPDTLS